MSLKQKKKKMVPQHQRSEVITPFAQSEDVKKRFGERKKKEGEEKKKKKSPQRKVLKVCVKKFNGEKSFSISVPLPAGDRKSIR